jgi:hypothetical protein
MKDRLGNMHRLKWRPERYKMPRRGHGKQRIILRGNKKWQNE